MPFKFHSGLEGNSRSFLGWGVGGGYRESGRRGRKLGLLWKREQNGGLRKCYFRSEISMFICFLFFVLLINLRALVHCNCFVFCVWHCFLKNVAVVVVLG